jgi:magnesium-transporting ATPase (P-type)
MDIDEALLTGESVPVNKSSPVIEGELVPLGDRVNMCYSSTTLTKGRGRGKLACKLSFDSDTNHPFSFS